MANIDRPSLRPRVLLQSLIPTLTIVIVGVFAACTSTPQDRVTVQPDEPTQDPQVAFREGYNAAFEDSLELENKLLEAYGMGDIYLCMNVRDPEGADQAISRMRHWTLEESPWGPYQQGWQIGILDRLAEGWVPWFCP